MRGTLALSAAMSGPQLRYAVMRWPTSMWLPSASP